jgi:hypothetical protein
LKKQPDPNEPQLSLIDFWYHQKEQAQQQFKIEHGLPPKLPSVFMNGYALAPSCLPLQHIVNSIQNAASGGDRWQHPDGAPPYYTGTSDAGSTIVEYNDENTTIELWKQVQSFTDLDADMFLMTLAHLLKSPLEDDKRSTWVFASDALDCRGIRPRMQSDEPGGEKRRAGHRQEDINDIARCMHRITNLWVTINQVVKEDETSGRRGRRKTKKTEYTLRSRVLNLESMWYQRELDEDANEPFLTKPPQMAPIGWKVRAGEWLEPFLKNRQVAYLCQQALEYDPHNELWEKRLARYFFFHFRMNARAGAFNREIGKLMETLSLPTNQRFPERTRQRFEKTLNRLHADKQIDGWEYTEQVELPARGWLPTWLQQKIRIYIAPYQPPSFRGPTSRQG